MKSFKRFLCVVLSLLLVTTGGLAEGMSQALTISNEEISASFEDVAFSDDASYDAIGNDDGIAINEDEVISASSVEPDVAEAEEMDLASNDGGDKEDNQIEYVGTGDIQADYVEPTDEALTASTVTYCFIVLDALVASHTAVEGEEIVAPDDPVAPEGMVFAGWELEDGTAVFVDGEPIISVIDPLIREINVIARFVAAPATTASSDEETGSENEAAATGDESVSGDDNVTVKDEGSASDGADETVSSVDNYAEADGDADNEKGVEAINDADAGKDADTPNDAEADKDVDNQTDDVNQEENKETVKDEGKQDGNAEPSADGDKVEDEPSEAGSSECISNENENNGEESDQENTINLVRVIFNVTPEEAIITVKAVNSESEVISADEALDESTDVQTADAQTADETSDETADNEITTTPIAAQDDGSFELLPGFYTYTASAEGYKSAMDVPFTVTEDALTIDVVLEAENSDSIDSMGEPEAEDAKEADDPSDSPSEAPFDQSVNYYGVVISVKADAGTFPVGSTLSVSRVLLYEQSQADAAVDEIRDENITVASSYTFDIKVLDEDGNELQPAEGQNVSVSFALAEVADENLETRVYHVTEEAGEMSAEALDVTTLETDENNTGVDYAAVVETDGFSIYTIEFIYKELQYVLPGYSSIALGEILDAVGLTGEVTAVEISNTFLFSASNETGEWVVYAHQAFSTTEWMKVTINGVTYEITVTDDPGDIKVIFDANGGVFFDENGNEDGDKREGYWEPGAEIRMEDYDWIQPVPGEDGKVFLGYADSQDEGAPNVLDWGKDYNIPENANGSITLYAVWANGLEVVFDANGGVFYDDEGNERTQSNDYKMPGWGIQMDDWMQPQRGDHLDGKAFLGYAETPNAREEDIILDWDKEFKIPMDATEPVKLYAVWGGGLTVIFDANGGAFYNNEDRKDGTQRVDYQRPGGKIRMDNWMEPRPEEDGKVFLGYARNSNATEADIVLDWGKDYTIPETATDPVMLYAVWGDGLHVIFDANGGTFYYDGRRDGTQRDGYWRYGSEIWMDDWMEPEPGDSKDMEGKVFLGYALTSDATEAGIVLHWGEDGGYKIPENPNAPITLFAVWDDGLQVIFDANGGAFYDDEGRRDGTHRHGYWRQGWKFRMERWMEPRAGKEDEVFLGYAEKPDASEKDIVLRWGEDGEYTIPENADKPITLYAVWDKGLKVTFDANGGAFYDDEGRKDGTQRHGYWRHGWGIEMEDWMEPEPGVEGQVFLGYALKQDAKEEEVVLSWVKEYKIPEYATASFTLFAVWGDGLQVIFDANGGVFYDDEGRKDGTQRVDYKRRGWDIWLDDWMEPHAGEEDQVFLGYALTDNAEEEDIVLSWGEDGKYTIPMDAPNPVKLYAVWDKGLKVILDANGGAFYDDDGREDGTQRDGYWMPGWDIRMEDWMCPDSEVEGKVFLGYAKNSNATEADIVFDWGREYKIPEDANDTITLYAVWDDGLKVTFDANGGAFYDNGRKDGTQRHGYWRHGWEIEMNGWMEPEHEEDGKVFLGYALTSDASEDDIVLHWGEDGRYEIPENANAPITLYAVWDKGVQVIFDANGGAFYDDGRKDGTRRDGYWMPDWYVEMDDWMEPEHEGDKVFLGYALKSNAGENDIVLSWGEEYKIPGNATAPITLYAVWGKGVQVVFDANGGAFFDEDGHRDGTQRDGYWMPGWSIEMDDWMEPEPGDSGDMEGKVFLGYAEKKDATEDDIVFTWGRRGEYRIPEDAKNPITLYAVWSDGLHVIFDANGGAFRDNEGNWNGTKRDGYWMPGQYIEMGDWLRPDHREDGKVFLGYALKPVATEDDIVLDWEEDYKISEDLENPEEPIRMYAVWSDECVHVIFDANGGAFRDDEGNWNGTKRDGYWMPGWYVEMDNWLHPDPEDLEGKVFLGYALKKDAGAPIVLDWGKDYKIPENAGNAHEPITLYAVWSDGLQVIFDANGGAFYSFYDDERYNEGVQRDGYWNPGWEIEMDGWMRPEHEEDEKVFLGYALKPNAEEEDIVLSWGREYEIPENATATITMYAVWSDGLKVTFNANGGAFYDDEGNIEGPQRDGYWMPDWDIEMDDWLRPEHEEDKVFLGYALKSNAGEGDIVLSWGKEYEIPENASAPITMYAVWSDGLQVIFDANGGTFYDDKGDKIGTRDGHWMPDWDIEMEGWMQPDRDDTTEDKVFLGYAQTSDATEAGIVLSWGREYDIPENAQAPITMYAVWGEGVQVVFDANGGVFFEEDGQSDKRTDYRMPGSSIEMDDWMRPDPNEATEGMVFLGYALEQNANATIVLEWGWNYDIPEKAEGTITMYAVWGEGRKVIFDPNGGTFYDEEGNVDENQRDGHWMPGQGIQMDEWWVPRAAVEGKVFLGYALRKNAAASIVLDRGREYEISENAGATTTLYAVWDEWGEPTYTWSEDNSRVTAQRAFKNHASIKDKKTIGTTSAVTTPATCTAKGKMTYTAKFDNYDSFSDQTKTVENIDALGHNWGEWVKVADATTSAPEQQRRTCTRCNTVETRSVGDKLPSAPATVAPAAPAAPATPAAPAESVTIPKAPASVKAKAAKKGKVTVSWKKIKKTKKTKALLAQIKGIEVQYSIDPTFATDVVTKPVGKNKVKVTLKLQKNTTYYVRVRYTDGAGGVSAWSGTKRVKTKKK